MTESSKEAFGWFSTSDLAKLGAARVVKLPGTVAGISNRASQDQWEKRQVPGKGGKGGLKTEYLLQEPELSIVETFLKFNPAFFAEGVSAQHVVGTTSLATPRNGLAGAGTQAESGLCIRDYVDAFGPGAPGLARGYEEVTVVVKFEASELRERSTGNLQALKLAHVKGDGMEPTLMHNDQVLIDTAVHTFIDDAIYAIQQDGHLRFKRVQKRMNGTIVIKSDNPNAGAPEVYTAEEASYFNVLGRVIPIKFGRFKI